MRTLIRIAAVAALIALTGASAWAAGSSEKAKTIKIGAIFPLTGEVAAYGQEGKNAVTLAVDEINAAGGILGRKVILFVEDDGASPKGAVSAAQKLVDIDKVDAIIGSLFSSSIIAARVVTDAKKIPVVVPMASHPDIYAKNGYVFSTQATTREGKEYLAEYWRNERKMTKLATLNGLTDAGVMDEGFIANAWKGSGGEVVIHESFTPGAMDYRTSLTKIKAAKPDVLWLSASYEDAVKIIRQMAEIDLKVTLTSDDMVKNAALLEAVGDVAEGMVIVESSQVLSDESQKKQAAFKKAWAAKFDGEPTMVGTFTYDCCQALFGAIARAGSTDGDAVRKQLAATDFEGVSGRVKFRDDGSAIRGASLSTIKNRQFVPMDYKPRSAY